MSVLSGKLTSKVPSVIDILCVFCTSVEKQKIESPAVYELLG